MDKGARGVREMLTSAIDGEGDIELSLMWVRGVVNELIAASAELKDVCNRPSAARTRAVAWRRFDRALAAATGAK